MAGSTIPSAILDKMRPADFNREPFLSYFRLLEQVLIQIQGQTGVVSGETSDQTSLAGYTLYSANAIDSVDYVAVSSDYTTGGNEYVRVSNNATITLNNEPDDQEVVIVQSISEGVTLIVGPLSGDTSMAITKAYDVVKLTYSVEFGEWLL